ncbi:hypothetical protein QYF61_008691 [Mycteria americana]|uniref:Uncharacterized protein n=1 Tax=Mycteria americana TaxID=33587 RepID=A0AAN7NL36_MYCAM|nr:hypothetical protein QYF61_008691 [Mycteria americana]
MLQLGSSSAEKGSPSDSKLNMSLQCAPAATNANSILSAINSSMASTGRGVIIPLCSALLRWHLEYHIQFQAPRNKKDINQMERGTEGSGLASEEPDYCAPSLDVKSKTPSFLAAHPYL